MLWKCLRISLMFMINVHSLLALFYVLHVVEACVIGMISAGWHVKYADELVFASVAFPMLSGTRVSLFVVSLALLGTVSTLANSWVLPLSCLHYHQSFCSICLCWPQAPCLQHRSIVFYTEVLPNFCCYKLSELQHGLTSVGVSLCHHLRGDTRQFPQ